MEHHYIIALKKCQDRREAIKLLAVLNDDKRKIKSRATGLIGSNSPSAALDSMLKNMRQEINKLTQIHNIITLRIKELGQQEKIANRLLSRGRVGYSEHFVIAAAGVLNKKTFTKIKKIAEASIEENKAVNKLEVNKLEVNK